MNVTEINHLLKENRKNDRRPLHNMFSDSKGAGILFHPALVLKIYTGIPSGVSEESFQKPFDSAENASLISWEKALNKWFYEITDVYDTQYVEALNLKVIDQLAQEIMLNGRKRKYVRLGDNLPCYDPKYLKSVRRILPEGKWYIRPDKGILSPLYILDDNAFMMLLPMRIEE